jgi:hypothetical protein
MAKRCTRKQAKYGFCRKGKGRKGRRSGGRRCRTAKGRFKKC